jgi:hypothetical protein
VCTCAGVSTYMHCVDILWENRVGGAQSVYNYDIGYSEFVATRCVGEKL